MTSRQNSTFRITTRELQQFSMLTSKGLDIESMIQIAFKEHEKILEELNQGKNFMDILSFHGSNTKILKKMSQYLNLKQCLVVIDQMDQSYSIFQKVILKKGMYPFMIFCFSYAILLFFIQWILPQMSQFLSDSSFHFGLWVLKMIYTGLFVFSFLFIISLLLYFHNIELKMFSRFYSFSLFNKIKTYQFSFLYYQLMNQGLSSQQCLELISNVKSIRSICEYILQGLKKGLSMETCVEELHLDSSFLFFFRAGIKMGNIEGMLKMYCENSIFEINKCFAKISVWIQCISYSCVGVLVIVVYQVLLLPLNILYEI